MNQEIQLLSLKLRQPPIVTVDPTEQLEADIWLTFKAFDIEDYCATKSNFLELTKRSQGICYWESEDEMKADFEEFDINRMGTSNQFNRMKMGVTQQSPYLFYKEKFDVFVYRQFFTWNLITQATVQEIKLLGQGIKSHPYTVACTFQSCLETLNAWST